MKKDRLYTVNKWNQPAFMREGNVFDGFGNSLLNNPNPFGVYIASPTARQYIDWSNPFQKAAAIGTSAGLVNGFSSIANTTNPFNNSGTATEQPTKGSALTGVLGAVGGTAGKLLGNAIADGYSTGGVGEGVADIGNMIGGAMQAIPGVGALAGTAVQFASGLVGGAINRGWGVKENKENIEAIKQNTAAARSTGNVMAGASTNEDVLNSAGMMTAGSGFSAGDLYKNGWWTNKGTKKGNELIRNENAALAFQNHGLVTGAGNADSNMDSDIMRNFAAYGGPIPIGRIIEPDSDNMGAIEYGFMNDWIESRRNREKNKGNDFVGKPQNTLLALGGDLQVHGADWSDGLVTIGAGGTHEENPNDGVQMGVDSQNIPNLVEEGEVIYNDYVYSNRIKCDETTKKKFHISKKREITYADLAKKLEKEIAERPNDPISKRGFEAQMSDLADEQERQKAEMEADRARKAFEALSPEEQTAIMQQRAMEEQAMMNQMAQEEALAQQQVMMQQADGSSAMLGQMPRQYGDGSKLVKKSNGQIDFENSIFEIPEIVITPSSNNVSNAYQALKMMATLQNLDRQRKQDELVDALLEDRKERRGRNEIHYYAPGGPLEGRDEDWYNELTDSNKWIADLYGIKNAEEFDAMPYSFKNGLIDLFEYSKNPEYADAGIDALYSNYNIDSDLYNAIKNRGYNSSVFAKLTPEQFREIYDDYMVDYNDFTSKHPYIPYGMRMDDGYRRQWDETYEGYVPTETPQTFQTPEETQEYMNLNSINPMGITVPTETYNVQGVLPYKNIPNQTPVTRSVYDWDDFWNRIGAYEGSIIAGNVKGNYRPDESFDYGDYKDIADLEGSKEYQDFTNMLVNNIRSLKGLGYKLIDPSKPATTSNIILSNGKPLTEDQANTLRYLQRATKRTAKGSNTNFFTPLEGNEDYYGLVDNAEDMLTRFRTDGKAGVFHLNPIFKQVTETPARDQPITPTVPVKKKPNAIISTNTTPVTSVMPKDNNYEVAPIHRAEWPRYAGLLGPTIGLGMMAAGVGKPDYSDLDAAVQSSGNAHLATYKPIGNYLTYRPMDIWYEQNRMDANARATDRAIVNNAAPVGTKMAGLLASGYNNQIANGELYRKALEYNDAKRKDVAEFNRGTDMFNSESFNRLSQFNASALNDAEGRRTNARLHAAQQKLANDAGWYNSLYGNVSGLFKGISDLGRENADRNQIARLVVSGAIPGVNPDNAIFSGYAKYAAKGGKLKRNKKRGLTF